MIEFSKFKLSNGLRVLHHEDKFSTMAVLNVLYNVGARDEEHSKTGFAHLFEHLMFGGSLHIPEYDKAVEEAGGANNAFTNNDFTNYYISVPVENIETAFWLESDRMLQLDFSEKSLNVQKGVVLEEFRQRCFNAPFGQLWHHVRELLYQVHPYQWPTIGKSLTHIENATLEDVETFYYRHYHPANAILSIAGNISFNDTKKLCEKWFGSIERTGPVNQNHYPAEPPQLERRFLNTTDISPNNAVFISWRVPGFSSIDSRKAEMFAEMLGGTETSPLYLELVKKSGLFNAAECFCMRSQDDGIFTIYGILNDEILHEEAEQKMMDILKAHVQKESFGKQVFQGIKNRIKSHFLFEKTSMMNVAQKLCFYELNGNVDEINAEVQPYDTLELEDVTRFASATFQQENASVIYYSPKK